MYYVTCLTLAVSQFAILMLPRMFVPIQSSGILNSIHSRSMHSDLVAYKYAPQVQKYSLYALQNTNIYTVVTGYGKEIPDIVYKSAMTCCVADTEIITQT